MATETSTRLRLDVSNWDISSIKSIVEGEHSGFVLIEKEITDIDLEEAYITESFTVYSETEKVFYRGWYSKGLDWDDLDELQYLIEVIPKTIEKVIFEE